MLHQSEEKESELVSLRLHTHTHTRTEPQMDWTDSVTVTHKSDMVAFLLLNVIPFDLHDMTGCFFRKCVYVCVDTGSYLSIFFPMKVTFKNAQSNSNLFKGTPPPLIKIAQC